MKDKLLLVCGSKDGGAGGAVPWPPSSVFTSKELLNPDKKGLKLPPKAATTAAYCKTMHYISEYVFVNDSRIYKLRKDGCIISMTWPRITPKSNFLSNMAMELKKWTLEIKKAPFPVLLLNYSSYSTVFSLTRFFSGPKICVKAGVSVV